MTTTTETIIRPKSTGWTILIAGLPIIGFGLFLLIGGLNRGVQITDFSGFVLMTLGLVAAGVALVVWGWLLLKSPKVMLVLHDAGIDFGKGRSSDFTSADWADIATLEIWRPQALHPGQRDRISFGLTDAAAERLGLGPARPDANAPGHTGKVPPRRLHFSYNAGQLSVDADALSASVTSRLTAKGATIDGPNTLQLGLASRQRWRFSHAADAPPS